MKVVVNSQQSKTVSVNTQGTTEVVSVGIQGPPATTGFYINRAQDVDTTGLADGAMLVYKADTSNWKVTKILDEQNVEGGQY